MQPIKLPSGIFLYDPAVLLGKRGGFGQVFLGKTHNGEDVAVKKLHLSAADAAHRELRIADELKGRPLEYVVPFVDAGEDADTGDYFVVMAKAEGSLQNWVDKNGHLAPVETASIILQIVKGLIEVGDLVHRDLKPDNVLLHNGKWKIADFGIARFIEDATATNTLKGCLSPHYAAPEQWMLERATHATDVYALGIVGFFLLTGHPPFKTNPEEQHKKEPLPSFDCMDGRLKSLINMMVRKIPETRPDLIRIDNVLADIVAKPQQSVVSNTLRALANTSAQVSEDEQRLQAEHRSREMERDKRNQLRESAITVLLDNVERLWGKIHEQAPNAKRINYKSVDKSFEFRLGSGSLVLLISRFDFDRSGNYERSGWDVVAKSQISARQNSNGYIWSAALFYAKPKGGTGHRWHEVSFFGWNTDSREQPFASFGADADFALSNTMSKVSAAFGPTVIDDEKEGEFHDRWIWLLSMAARGQLKCPSSLPISSWPPKL
ncbi:MAG: serine/threonine-protein kinase [Planctomycetota bacterium]